MHEEHLGQLPHDADGPAQGTAAHHDRLADVAEEVGQHEDVYPVGDVGPAEVPAVLRVHLVVLLVEVDRRVEVVDDTLQTTLHSVQPVMYIHWNRLFCSTMV